MEGNGQQSETQKQVEITRMVTGAPYLYMAPAGRAYLVAAVLGKMDAVNDLEGTLDWWIKAPWMLNTGRGTGIALFANA